MNKHEIVLAALAAGGENATFSPVQVQKLLFLIDREAAKFVNGPHFDFRPYDYGPFDSNVYDTLAALEAGGLVRSTPLNRYRVYALSLEGYRSGAQLLATLGPNARAYLIQAAAWIRGLSFQQLVAAIYNKYPDMKVNSVFRG
jgi:hypothetical protein